MWVRNTREDENLAEDAKRALFFQLPGTCVYTWSLVTWYMYITAFMIHAHTHTRIMTQVSVRTCTYMYMLHVVRWSCGQQLGLVKGSHL